MKAAYQPRALFQIGMDSDEFTYATRSWSDVIDEDTGEIMLYELTVDRRNGDLRCSCPDAQFRQKVGNILDLENSYICKHARCLVRYHLRDLLQVK